jgi:hypothetical protein
VRQPDGHKQPMKRSSHFLVSIRHAARPAARQGAHGGRCGAVTASPRFGGAINRNIHFHSRVLDGVYTRASASTPAWCSTVRPR